LSKTWEYHFSFISSTGESLWIDFAIDFVIMVARHSLCKHYVQDINKTLCSLQIHNLYTGPDPVETITDCTV